MKVTAELIFETSDAESIYWSILPEVKTTDFERSVVDISINESDMALNITASDLVSMRSALNAWLRLVQIAYETRQVTQPFLIKE
ncbi:MAG: KEOPS complex subunit Pcc1 [Methanohalobium sp.]|uniref:KEOPS complex subunit Pcc1 n=1 Tax=Methanohalobium sp. TaxID=2837493 RepID=UPI00397988DD